MKRIFSNRSKAIAVYREHLENGAVKQKTRLVGGTDAGLGCSCRYGATTDNVLKKVTDETVAAVLKPVLAEDALLCTDGAPVYRALAGTEGIEHHALITS